jgi:hypothetical protein
MKKFKCSCGHEIYVTISHRDNEEHVAFDIASTKEDKPPAPMKWSDGHVCYFNKDNEKE